VKYTIKLVFTGKVPWSYERQKKEVTPYWWEYGLKKKEEKYKGK